MTMTESQFNFSRVQGGFHYETSYEAHNIWAIKYGLKKLSVTYKQIFVHPLKANNVDLTLIPGKIGGDVSQAVHDKLVAKLNINDRGFMVNYAFVETEFGKNVR